MAERERQVPQFTARALIPKINLAQQPKFVLYFVFFMYILYICMYVCMGFVAEINLFV